MDWDGQTQNRTEKTSGRFPLEICMYVCINGYVWLDEGPLLWLRLLCRYDIIGRDGLIEMLLADKADLWAEVG
jgi:hypothetical protein